MNVYCNKNFNYTLQMTLNYFHFFMQIINAQKINCSILFKKYNYNIIKKIKTFFLLVLLKLHFKFFHKNTDSSRLRNLSFVM